MSRTAWKRREREVARKTSGRRYPANMGGRVDVETDSMVIQVKERQRLSLAAIEALALEMDRVGSQKSPPKFGAVWAKRSAGRGRETPWLVIVSEATWRAMNGRRALTRASPLR